jgi:hypothetical protein
LTTNSNSTNPTSASCAESGSRIGLSNKDKVGLENNFFEFINKRKFRFRGKYNLNILDLEQEITKWNKTYTSFLYHASINPEIIYQKATEICEEARLFRKQIRDIAEKIVHDEELKLLS